MLAEEPALRLIGRHAPEDGFRSMPFDDRSNHFDFHFPARVDDQRSLADLNGFDDVVDQWPLAFFLEEDVEVGGLGLRQQSAPEDA